jgi:hypothetical protein
MPAFACDQAPGGAALMIHLHALESASVSSFGIGERVLPLDRKMSLIGLA